MNNNMLGQAMLITYAEMGVKIDMFDNTDNGIILLFTVPKNSYDKDVNNIEMSGKHLASRVKHTLEEMGVFFADCRYGIRDEYWTKDNADAAKKIAYKDMGYRDWQIDKF